MKLKEIKALIEFVSEQGFAEFEIEQKGLRLRIRRFSETLPPSAGPLFISSALGPGELPPRRTEQRAIDVELATSPKPATAEPDSTPPATQSPEPEPQLHLIKSPIVGTFYRAASPNADPFVRAGDRIVSDTVVCIIEAMKLMNEIQAEVSGEVAKIFVENGQPVEYGQPLFGIKV